MGVAVVVRVVMIVIMAAAAGVTVIVIGMIMGMIVVVFGRCEGSGQFLFDGNGLLARGALVFNNQAHDFGGEQHVVWPAEIVAA